MSEETVDALKMIVKDMADGLALMRKPFPENQISLLPKPTKKRDEMDKLPKARCKACGGWHATSNVIHLSYVGHAALTDRLLDADPEWTWEPMTLKDGLPAYDANGGLWIKLTVHGVTRLGYGHAGDKEGGDAIKEVIGDALRNAAMRFGAALELWHKGGELHPEETKDAGKSVDQELATDGLPVAVVANLRKEAKKIEGDFYTISAKAALASWNALKKDTSGEEQTCCWLFMDSKVRSGIKKAGEANGGGT